MRRWRLSAVGPPHSMSVMHRASVDASACLSLSRRVSSVGGGLFKGAASGKDQRMSKAELLAQAAHDLAVGDAGLRGLDDPLIDVLVPAVGGPRQSI